MQSDGSAGYDGKGSGRYQVLENRFVAAFKAKDVNAIMACYMSDPAMNVFDVSPPRQYTGSEAYKKDWQDLFAAFPGPLDGTLSDLDIATGGDIAYGHSIQHASFTDKDELTVRVTDGYKRVNGQWLIAHEHVSIPVDLATLKPDPVSK
jgi:ketosteroid isomerase-like protein